MSLASAEGAIDMTATIAAGTDRRTSTSAQCRLVGITGRDEPSGYSDRFEAPEGLFRVPRVIGA